MKLHFASAPTRLAYNVTVMKFSAKLCMRGARPAWARIARRRAHPSRPNPNPNPGPNPKPKRMK